MKVLGRIRSAHARITLSHNFKKMLKFQNANIQIQTMNLIK